MAKKPIRLRCPYCGQNKLFQCEGCGKTLSSKYVENAPKELTNKQKAIAKLIMYVAEKSEQIGEMDD